MPNEPGAGDRPQHTESNWLGPLVNRFQEAWNSGARPPLDEHLPEDAARRPIALAALGAIDLQRRLQAGEAARVESYLERYPELARDPVAVVALAQAEFAQRRQTEPSLTPAEYIRRFPEHRQQLHALIAEEATAAELPASATGPRVNAGTAEDVPAYLGRHRVERVLGQGGFGRVYLAHDEQLQRAVAIKVPHRGLVATPADAEAYLAEARVVASLDHPHIVPVLDVGQTPDGCPFVVSKYLQGSDLARRLKVSRLSQTEAAEVVATVAEALHHAHKRGLVHRDVKPANILLDDAGTPHLTDFGIALREEDYGKRPGVCGTPSYMSPEQASGEGHRVDGRSDIFSLGVVFYELLTGRCPFRGETPMDILIQVSTAEARPPRQIEDTIPRELERVCLKAISKKASERYTTAKDLAEDLRRFLTHAPESDKATHRDRPDEDSPPAAPVVPFSLENLKKSDVLLSYAAIDDQPLFEDRPGWVSQLHRNLVVRVEQLSGEKVLIARLPESAVAQVVEGELLEQLPHAKAMISVVSPPFLKSDVCRKEVERFWRGAEQSGGAWVNDKARLLKVLKTAVSAEEIPRPLADIFFPLAGFEFFELDSETGRVREFDETFGPLLKQRFFERVYDLAYDTCQLLRTFQQVRARGAASLEPDSNRQWVYLATTTSDVQDERDRIRRELLERGHRVLPEAPLPMLSRDVEATVRQCLEKCTLAIHLLGRHYGVTPEDSSESIPALQLRLTAEHSGRPELPRLIWLAGGGRIADQRQHAFVLRVQEDPALHQRADIIEGNLNLLKRDLIRRLAPPQEKPKEATPSRAAGGAPKLYLICDPKDEPHVEPLEDYLFDRGLEVCLPAFDGDDADAAALHQDNLRTCDAVLVYYGVAPRAWVDIKLRELLKAAGYGREKPLAVQAIYIAPPYDHRKERYRSHQAGVIRQTDAFAPSMELDAFVSQVKEACA